MRLIHYILSFIVYGLRAVVDRSDDRIDILLAKKICGDLLRDDHQDRVIRKEDRVKFFQRLKEDIRELRSGIDRTGHAHKIRQREKKVS